jgi:branched-chain amino acid transport system substrate-binding protein
MKSSIKKILVASTLFAGVLAGCSGGHNSSGGNSGGGDAKGDTIKIAPTLSYQEK